MVIVFSSDHFILKNCVLEAASEHSRFARHFVLPLLVFSFRVVSLPMIVLGLLTVIRNGSLLPLLLSCHIVLLPVFSYKTTQKGYILNLCPHYYTFLCVTLVLFHINSLPIFVFVLQMENIADEVCPYSLSVLLFVAIISVCLDFSLICQMMSDFTDFIYYYLSDWFWHDLMFNFIMSFCCCK